jgi:protein-histidine pros-kinase
MDCEHPAVETDPLGPDPADLSKLLRGIRGDEAFLRRLIANFLADYPARLESLRQAVFAGDAGSVDQAAHGLRGSLTIFGAEAAGSLAAEVEALARAGTLAGAEEALGRLEVEINRLSEFLARRLEAGP